VEAQARCIYEVLYTEFERWYLERQYNYQWHEFNLEGSEINLAGALSEAGFGSGGPQ
jgi:hypothetical protein